MYILSALSEASLVMLPRKFLFFFFFFPIGWLAILTSSE